MELIRELGAFAGLAAFIGLAVLALLYFAQARDVRRLRENAEFLVEGEVPAPPAPIGADDAEQATQAPGAPPSDAEAFRRAELARQAADRRERFESRRRGEGDGFQIPSTAVIAVGTLILIAGVAFGATRLLGGDDETAGGGGGGQKGQLACAPGQTQVAVLNGTAEAGLAQGSAQQIEQRGYEVRPVTNTESGFDASVVMFAQQSQQCAPEVGQIVGIQETESMDQEIQGIAEGAAVAVVLGEDRASGGTSTDSSATDTAGTLGD
jgi:hypothetical protein